MDNEKWIIVLLIMLWRMPDYSFFIIHYSLFIIICCSSSFPLILIKSVAGANVVFFSYLCPKINQKKNDEKVFCNVCGVVHGRKQYDVAGYAFNKRHSSRQVCGGTP